MDYILTTLIVTVICLVVIVIYLYSEVSALKEKSKQAAHSNDRTFRHFRDLLEALYLATPTGSYYLAEHLIQYYFPSSQRRNDIKDEYAEAIAAKVGFDRTSESKRNRVFVETFRTGGQL